MTQRAILDEKRTAMRTAVSDPAGEPFRLREGLLDVEVSEHRKLDCPGYDQCVAAAGDRCWPSFSCSRCLGPGQRWMQQRCNLVVVP